MERSTIEKGIASIVRKYTGHITALESRQRLDAIGVDSVTAIEILIAIEEDFDVEFSDSEISMTVFRDIESLTSLVFGALNRDQ